MTLWDTCQNRSMNNCQKGTESNLGHTKFEMQEQNPCDNLTGQLGSWNRAQMRGWCWRLDLEVAHPEVIVWSFDSKSECQGEACETGEESQKVNLLEGAPGGNRKWNQVRKSNLGMVRREKDVRLCTFIKGKGNEKVKLEGRTAVQNTCEV